MSAGKESAGICLSLYLMMNKNPCFSHYCLLYLNCGSTKCDLEGILK